MLSDRQTLDPAAVAPARGGGWIHCSVRAARRSRAALASSGPRPTFASAFLRLGAAEPARVSRCDRDWRRRADLVVAAGQLNRSWPPTVPAAAASALQGLAPVVIVTSGPDGSAAAAGELRIESAADALPGPLLDATGSGDAYTAALLVELAEQPRWPPPEAELRAAMEMGSRMGALVARVHGAGTVAASGRRMTLRIADEVRTLSPRWRVVGSNRPLPGLP